MIKVGLLDGQTIQAVIFAKQLRKAGFYVVLFCESKLSYGYFTRYAHKKVSCPSTQKQTQQFHKFFLDYLNDKGLDVVVPMNDYSAKYLSEYKHELQPKVKFTIPNLAVFKKGYDKNQLMRVCAETNLPHPRSLDISKLKKGQEPADFTFPALIKPNETTGARGFKKVKNYDEMWQNIGPIVEEFGPCHLQEFIPSGGTQFKVQILIRDGKNTLSTVIEKQRYYPVSGGSSCFNRTIEAKNLVAICEKALQEIEWNGFADFDLIEDPRDGSIKIMEINPRVPACIKASVVSGVDFPAAIVAQSLGNPIQNYSYTPNKYLRYFSMDLLWLLSSPQKEKAFRKWAKGLFSSNHYLQDGEWADPMPFIMGSYSGLAKQLNPKFRKQKKGMNP
jgi:predicted ATP-grasp superfamily ATP-dependent carboligase